MKNCEHCDAPFLPRDARQRFCSEECRREENAEDIRGIMLAINEPLRSLESVATELGLSKSTVDNIERAALAKLRERMAHADFF